MKSLIIFAVFGLAVAVPTPGLQFKNLYKPVAGAHKALRPRIIGGNEAAPHSRPFQAFLEVHNETGLAWYCGGQVISSNYLLTAGHCGDGAYGAGILLGAHDISNTMEPTQVVVESYDINVHPQYNAEEITNDLCAFWFTAPIGFNENIQPVALPTRADAANTFVGETATVSGWGVTRSNGENLSPLLKSLESPIVPNSQCEAETLWTIPATQICISGGSDGTGFCSGDSGGPLTVKVNDVDTLVGIASYGVKGCLSGYPSVFTRVTYYLDWIAANTDAVVT